MIGNEWIFLNKKFALYISIFCVFFCYACKKKDEREPGYTDEEIRELSADQIMAFVNRFSAEQRKAFLNELGKEEWAEIWNKALNDKYASPKQLLELMKKISKEELRGVFENMDNNDASKFVNSLRGQHFGSLEDKALLAFVVKLIPKEVFVELTDEQKLGLAVSISGSSNEEECLSKMPLYNELLKKYEDLLDEKYETFWFSFRGMNGISSLDGQIGSGAKFKTNSGDAIQQALDELKKGEGESHDIGKVANGVNALLKYAKCMGDVVNVLSKQGKAGSELESLKNSLFVLDELNRMFSAFGECPESMDINHIENGLTSMISTIKKHYEYIEKFTNLKDIEEIKKLKLEFTSGPISSMINELEKNDNDIKIKGFNIGRIVNGIEEMANRLNNSMNISLQDINQDIGANTLNAKDSFIATMHRLMLREKDKGKDFKLLGYTKDTNILFDQGTGGDLKWIPVIRASEVGNPEIAVKQIIADLAAKIYNDGGAPGAAKGVNVLKMHASNAGQGPGRTKIIFTYGGNSLRCSLERGHEGGSAVTGDKDFDYSGFLLNPSGVTVSGE